MEKLVKKAKYVFCAILLILTIVAATAPCLLVLSCGQNGEFTIWNVVGLAWCCFIAWFVKTNWEKI